MDAHGPTAPQPRATIAIAIAVALLVGLAIGVLVGRATTTPPVTTPASITRGHLRVASKPIEGNVVVDGRFVGISPIDRLDLDVGKHSIVIDAFGYQPYAGTLALEPEGTLNLSVTLAPLGVDAPTIGSATGAGTAQHAVVPPSALLPPAASAPAATEPSHKAAASRPSSPAPARAPSPPRRDCNAEKSRCHDSCSRAETDCRFACPGCSSCLTSVGWDECKRQCDTCRGGCDQNTKFCESSCDNQYNNCEASQ